jgi:hypothetical protein
VVEMTPNIPNGYLFDATLHYTQSSVNGNYSVGILEYINDYYVVSTLICDVLENLLLWPILISPILSRIVSNGSRKRLISTTNAVWVVPIQPLFDIIPRDCTHWIDNVIITFPNEFTEAVTWRNRNANA